MAFFSAHPKNKRYFGTPSLPGGGVALHSAKAGIPDTLLGNEAKKAAGGVGVQEGVEIGPVHGREIPLAELEAGHIGRRRGGQIHCNSGEKLSEQRPSAKAGSPEMQNKS